MQFKCSGTGALVGAMMCLAAPVASAQYDTAQEYNLPGQDLGDALRTVALASHSQIIFSTELVSGLRAPPLKGRFTRDDAIAGLLSGSGLRAVRVGETLVIRREPDASVAQEDAPGESAGAIVVTGTRMRGRAPVGVPVITLDRKAIDQGGFSTTQQIAQSIPQNFGGGANENTGSVTLTGVGNGNAGRGAGVNLRGLGQTSTLVLLNGDRPPLGGATGTFADLSMIPASAIERIEIVPDGSSAIYGSDAVAGVVNIIARLNFRGAETGFRVGTADGDSQEYQFSQLIGGRWSGGHAMVAYEYYRRDRLAAADRPYVMEDRRAFGGPDRRGNYANPGTIFAGGQSFAIPAGQNGIGLPVSRLTAGAINRGDGWIGADILPDQRRHSVFAAASQEIGDFRFYAHGLASVRDFDQAIKSTSDSRRTVPVTNPFYVDPIGTRQPVGVQYSFVRDLGNERQSGRVRAYGITAGIETNPGDWRVDLHGTWGRQSERYGIYNSVNTARLALALSDTNPATAYNLFGDGPNTNPATIESIRGYSVTPYSGTVWSGTLRADGPLLTLPAGDLRLAIGGEYREDRYDVGATIAYTSSLTPRTIPGAPLLDVRRVKGVYAELLVPVFGAGARIPGFHRLDLSAALRTEEYSDFGRTTNPKLGIAWEPLSGLTARASFGKSFRAPGFQELRQDPNSMAIFAFTVADPQSATGESNIIVIRGNDPDLRPERATTWTVGGDMKPAFLPGFRAGVTWFDVDYRDRIASPAANLASFLVNRDVYAPIISPDPSAARVTELFASPIYLDLLGIPQSAHFVAVVDARVQNLSVVRQSGLDIDLGYSFGLGSGLGEFGAVATKIFHIRQALTATAPANDVVGTAGNPVDLRVRGRATYSSNGFGAALFLNFVDGYLNKTVAPAQPVRSWTTFDLNLSYNFERQSGPLAGLRIALNASNLFDRDPPSLTYVVGQFTNGYDAENASPLGRFVALQLTKSW